MDELTKEILLGRMKETFGEEKTKVKSVLFFLERPISQYHSLYTTFNPRTLDAPKVKD